MVSSAAREFQKANASLRQSHATKSADGPPKEASAFHLDSSQLSQKVTVTHMESLAQSVFCARPPPAFNSMEPEEALGRSPGGLAHGEESRKEEAEREAEGEEEGKASGEKEEGGEMEAPDGPFLIQMVTEAIETAIQEVNPREAHLESSWLKAGKSPAGISSDSSSSLEEENPLPLRSTEGLEKAQEDHRGGGQPTEPMEELQICEDFAEVNGGQDAWAELQGTEEAWLVLKAEAPLPRAERTEGGGGAVLVPGEKEAEWKEREVDEELPALLAGMLGNALGEAPKNSEFAPEATKHVNGSQEGREFGSPLTEGAPEVDPEEVCGGAEDVEVASPKDLLSQERKEPQSPPRCDLQAEHLEVEGNPAKGGCSPTSHAVLSAGKDFLEAEQENVESREELLPEINSALLENEEKGLDSELFCMEEDALPRSSGSAIDEDGFLAGEPKGAESREVTDEEKEEEEEKKGEGVVGPLPTEDVGDEGRMETEGYLDLEAPKGILELGATLPEEDLASIQVQETLQGEPGTEVPEEEQLPEEQKGEGEGGLPETPLQAEESSWEERDWVTISGGPEREDVTDGLQTEEARGAVVMESLLWKKENGPQGSEEKGWALDNQQAGEQLAEAKGPSREEATGSEEVQEVGLPPEAKAPVGDSLSQREDSGWEETLEHSAFAPGSQNERGGAGEENVQRGETLPGQPALDSGLTMPETPSLPSSEGEEVEAPTLEEEPASLWLAKEGRVEECPPKGESSCRAQEEGPCSEEPLAAGRLAKALMQTLLLTGDREAEGPGEAELEGAPGLEAEEDPWQEGEVARGPAIPKEEVGAELPLEPGDGFGFPADGLDPNYTQQEEEEEEEDQGPLEFSNQELTDVAPAKVSPLTSVTDLGEIVLESDSSVSGPKEAVEADMLEPCEDECFHVLDPEDLIQQKLVAVEDPTGTGFPETSPEDVVSLPLESKRDPNILEIVEQALEFNQELRKAAEHELGSLGKGSQCSSEERSPYAPPASLDQDPPPVPTEAPEGSMSIPREVDPLGGSQANGLQELSLDEFPSELLNGLGQGKGDLLADEDFIKEMTITPQFCTEDNFPTAETLNQSPPPVPVGEEGFRSGDSSPEVLEKVSLDQEPLDENILDDLQQKACVRGGKDTKLEPMPFLFGDEIRRQPLEFRPEGDLDLQPSEGN